MSNDPWSQFVPQQPGQNQQADPWAQYVPKDASPQLDKYQQAAIDSRNQLQKSGNDPTMGYGGRMLNGAMFSSLPTVMAGLETPLSMIAHGTMSPSEGYNYAKAEQDLSLADAQKKQGYLGDAAQLAGGVGSGIGLASNGVTFTKAGAGLMGRIGGMAGDGAAIGAANGFLGGGNSLSDRLGSAAQDGVMGGVLGGAMPLAGKVLSTAANPLISNIAARWDPEGYATSKLAKALSESGKSVPEVQSGMQEANLNGQGDYALADAMGLPGQRLTSTVARAPGDGRTEIANFLENRQSNQSRRLSGALADSFDAPDTAAQRIASLTADRRITGDANYTAAREGASAVDVTPAIDIAKQITSPGVNGLTTPASNITENSVQGIVQKAQNLLTDGTNNLTGFDNVKFAKTEIRNMMDSASPTQKGFLKPIHDALDDQLSAASPDYANARNTYRQQSQNIEAVDTGKAAAMRGRADDTIPAFQNSSPGQQSAFRAGYVDPLIEQITNAPIGVNKARMFSGDGPQQEISAFASPGKGAPLLGNIARENQMFETRQAAMGGSKTADNLNDSAALGTNLSALARVLHGDWGGAAKSTFGAISNAANGNTEAVRNHLAKLLLTRNGGGNLEQLLGNPSTPQAGASALVRALGQGQGSLYGQLPERIRR